MCGSWSYNSINDSQYKQTGLVFQSFALCMVVPPAPSRYFHIILKEVVSIFNIYSIKSQDYGIVSFGRHLQRSCSTPLLEGGAAAYSDPDSLHGRRFYSLSGPHAQMPHIIITNPSPSLSSQNLPASIYNRGLSLICHTLQQKALFCQ